MKHINYISCLRRLSGMLLLPLLLGGCLTENPEMTEDGELGVDPTSVQLNIALHADRGIQEGMSPQTSPDKKDGYVHRFIVEAYLNRRAVVRKVLIQEMTDDAVLHQSVILRLHARRYQIAVWSDYVKADATTRDLYYDTSDLVPVVPIETAHVANTPYKETFTASVEADLSTYENQLNAQVPLDINLVRPAARYELVANDVSSFLRRVASGKVSGERFTVRVKYADPIAEGFNVLDGIPKYTLGNMQYAETFLKPAEGTQKLTIGFDYVFLSIADEQAYIPLMVEVMDDKNTLIASSYVRIPCRCGRNTLVQGAFLTTTPGDGIGFDPEYDGRVDMDVTIE